MDESRCRNMPQAEKDLRIQESLIEAEVPKKFRATTFETFNPSLMPGLDTAAYDICKTFSTEGSFSGKPGLLLIGTPGTGKSSLGVCILRAFIERWRGNNPVRFWNVPRGLIAIQQEFGQDNRESTSIIDLGQYPLLMLDDLGKHKWSEWAQHQFYALLDDIWSEEKPVIITTNESDADFMRLDDALISRITGSCYMVQVRGKDHRLITRGDGL